MKRKILLLDKLSQHKRGKAVIEDCPISSRPLLYNCKSCQWYAGLLSIIEIRCKYECTNDRSGLMGEKGEA